MSCALGAVGIVLLRRADAALGGDGGWACGWSKVARADARGAGKHVTLSCVGSLAGPFLLESMVARRRGWLQGERER